MTVWVVLIQHASRDAWVDGVYELESRAKERAEELEAESTWLDASVESFEVVGP